MSSAKSANVRQISAEGAALGRLASYVAKLLINGETVHVYNTEQLVLNGSWEANEREWEHSFELRSVINPFRYSPKRYVRPDTYFRSVVRGMLPIRKPKGRDAFSRLRAYVGAPSDANLKLEKPDFALARSKKRSQTLGKVSRRFGWKGSTVFKEV